MSSSHVIEDVTVTAILAPLNAEFRGSFYHIHHRGTIIIQLRSSEGIVGEAYLGDEDSGLPELLGVIQREAVPKVVGADALSPARLWQRLYPLTYNIRRAKRISQLIVGAFDAAMWDLLGKASGQPLWRLWGGARERLPIIAIGGYYGEPLGPLNEEIARYHELGLAGIKFKVGGVSPSEDAARVRQAREAGGEDFILCVDANQGLSVSAAIELSQRLDGLGVRWFEEPVTWHNDRRGLRDVRMLGNVPVCAGQSELSPSGCRDLMETASIDVCNFDASMGGGPTAWLRTAAIASGYDVMMAHHEEPQVSSHLLASQPHSTYVECFHPDRDPFWWQLIATERQIECGELVMSERPGLGWELDWDYIDKYRVTSD
jgi:L-alanine-DL-glutamate epimerase-like enolase superfamily enzyme